MPFQIASQVIEKLNNLPQSTPGIDLYKAFKNTFQADNYGQDGVPSLHTILTQALSAAYDNSFEEGQNGIDYQPNPAVAPYISAASEAAAATFVQGPLFQAMKQGGHVAIESQDRPEPQPSALRTAGMYADHPQTGINKLGKPAAQDSGPNINKGPSS